MRLLKRSYEQNHIKTSTWEQVIHWWRTTQRIRDSGRTKIRQLYQARVDFITKNKTYIKRTKENEGKGCRNLAILVLKRSDALQYTYQSIDYPSCFDNSFSCVFLSIQKPAIISARLAVIALVQMTNVNILGKKLNPQQTAATVALISSISFTSSIMFLPLSPNPYSHRTVLRPRLRRQWSNEIEWKMMLLWCC